MMAILSNLVATYCSISPVWGPRPPVFKVKDIPWGVPVSLSRAKIILFRNAHPTVVFGSAWKEFASQWAKVEAFINDGWFW